MHLITKNMSNTTTECECCTEPFTETKRKQVACHSCEYAVCRECVKTFLIGSLNEPACMNCSKPWGTNFVASQMSKGFMNGPLKAAKERVLWEGQLAQMPDTQTEIEGRRAIKAAEARIAEMKDRHYMELRPLKNALRGLQGGAPLDENGRRRPGYELSGTQRKVRAFVKSCSGGTCNGFLNTDWNCGICEKATCKDCHAYLDDPEAEHTCDEADVETAKLLARDTKSCPRCGVSITKISGCDQMWCSQCHVSFSWKTNEIVNGSVHNPHYFEWARTQAANGQIPRQPGDRPGAGCDAPNLAALLVIDHRATSGGSTSTDSDDMSTDGEDSSTNPPPPTNKLSKLCMLSRHIRHVELNKHTYRQKTFLESRVEYLLGRKNKKTLCSELFKDYKDREKKGEIRGILEVFVAVVDELLVEIQNENVGDNYQALDSIVQYTNESLAKVSDIRGSVKLFIMEDYSYAWGKRVLYSMVERQGAARWGAAGRREEQNRRTVARALRRQA